MARCVVARVARTTIIMCLSAPTDLATTMVFYVLRGMSEYEVTMVLHSLLRLTRVDRSSGCASSPYMA